MTNMNFGGDWTRQKLEILRQYLVTYTTVLKKRKFTLTYVDAFAGEGVWSPQSEYRPEDYAEFQNLAKGSAAIALDVDDKPFDRLVFIEKDPGNAASLRDLRDAHPNRDVAIIEDDANNALPDFCQRMEAFDRAVVFLDPFKTEVSWSTVEAVAKTQKIDCWILFPIMAISRMMPLENEPSEALSGQLDRIFGGRDFWSGLYSPSPQQGLFDTEQRMERRSGAEGIARHYRERLKSAFAGVARTDRILLNSRNSPLFDLFFAAGNPTGAKRAMPIANHILKNW